MSNLFVVFIFVFLILIFLFLRLLLYEKTPERSTKKINSGTEKSTEKGEENNPDINTKNWDLHKIRLIKFGRSQYKGLTFFVSTENRIYYLSKEGNKIYC